MKLGYYKDGFTPDSCVQNSGLIHLLAADVSIVKGQALHDDGNGYATNATTAFAATFLGIAAADVDNSGGDGLKVKVHPPIQDYRFWVKVEADALVTQTAIGSTVDLEANDSVDISDVTVASWGFKILAIDVSTDAVAINTFGYVQGVFEKQPQ